MFESPSAQPLRMQENHRHKFGHFGERMSKSTVPQPRVVLENHRCMQKRPSNIVLTASAGARELKYYLVQNLFIAL